MYQGGKPSTGKLYVYVAPPTPVGAWSMALVLRQHIEYYTHTSFGGHVQTFAELIWLILKMPP